jgi:hypothetical protein
MRSNSASNFNNIKTQDNNTFYRENIFKTTYNKTLNFENRQEYETM